MPYPLPLTRTEAYLAYKAGVITAESLKPSLSVPRIGIDAWLAYWTSLTETYPITGVGKNLMPLNDLTDRGIISEYNSETGVLHSEGTTTANYPRLVKKTPFEIDSGTTYTMSVQETHPYTVHLRLYYDDTNYFNASITPGETTVTNTITQDCTHIEVLYQTGAGTSIDEDFKIQFEIGPSATDYEPYTGEPLCLTQEEAYVAYLSGVLKEYPENALHRVSAYLRYLISARWGRPDHPLNRQELYLSLLLPPYIPSGDPSSDITIDGTCKAPFIDVKMYGDTYQQTYTGKNLINPSAITGTNHGITYSFDQATNEITLNGTATDKSTCYFSNENRISLDGEYTLSYEKVSGSITPSGTCRIEIAASSWGSNTIYLSLQDSSASITATKTFDVYAVDFNIGQGTVCNNFKIKLQLEKSASATSFEPYVGRQASPNPYYPQTVKTVTGEQNIVVTGKNLLSLSPNTDNGLTGNIQDDSIVTITGKATNSSAKIAIGPTNIPAGTYTFSIDTPRETVTNLIIGTGNGTVPFRITPGQTSVTATLTESGTDYSLWVGAVVGTTYNDTRKLQLELGSTPTDFTKYDKQTLPIDLGSIELCKIGTYQDYIYKNEGEWKIRSRIVKTKLVSTLSGWSISSFDTQKRLYIPSQNAFGTQVVYYSTNNDPAPQVCSHFINISAAELLGGETGIAISSSGYLSIRDNNQSTAQGFKDWIDENEPVVYAVRATPTDIPITNSALIAQLDALVNGGAEDGTTYIKVSATAPNLPALLTVDAPKYA